MKELVFKVQKNGKVDVEAFGFTGGQCTEASKPFLDKISNNNGQNVVLKNEFYEQQEEQVEEQSY